MEILDTLEEKINKILQTVEALKKHNAELTEKIIEKEEEVNGLSLQVNGLLSEKERVKEKVEHLLRCVEIF